jgi:hypothetical protein
MLTAVTLCSPAQNYRHPNSEFEGRSGASKNRVPAYASMIFAGHYEADDFALAFAMTSFCAMHHASATPAV